MGPSRHQLQWQEYMSQYDFTICYIHGEDNTVADALSRLPPSTYPDEKPAPPLHESWRSPPVGAILSIAADASFLDSIREGYLHDKFSEKFISAKKSVYGIQESNGLWYIGGRLLIPRYRDVHEQLFRLAHDSLGHFGFEKSYSTLCDSYYWQNM